MPCRRLREPDTPENGSFSLNSAGVIVTKAGYPVLDNNGNPLTVPSGVTQITADIAGNLTSAQGAIGQLKLATFDNQQVLAPVGNGLYNANNAPEIAVAKPHILQGMLESSNVNAIVELTEMDKISSAYMNQPRSSKPPTTSGRRA